MIAPLLLTIVAQTVVPAPIPSTPTTDPCASVVLPGSKALASRAVTADDLAGIADIGPAIAEQTSPAFGISPAGDRIAFVVKRANPQANAYCQRLLVVSLAGGGEAVEIARGGAYLHDDFRLRDFPFVRAGWDKPNPPRWSPDARQIAYLRREIDSTQVWLADPAGATLPRQATRLPDDVDAFAWAPDGAALVVATRPAIRALARAIGAEGASGYLFDERFSPQFADHPIPTGAVATEYTLVSLADGSTRAATSEERVWLAPPVPAGIPASARSFRSGPGGSSAWLELKEPDRLLSPTRLVVSRPGGQRQRCESAACEGMFDLWWPDEDRALLVQQRTGWARSETTLLRWDEGASAPRRILVTSDLLIGCDLVRQELVCAREGTTQPRRLVAIDIRSGAERVVHDPNSGLGHIRWGAVQRLRFRNSYGVESFADLVLPPGHKPGQRHPLVVVQYSSRGFLRGGTGDEVPIQPLAARGFAVLSFQRPGPLPEAYKARSEIETHTLFDDPWADRRQVMSSLEKAVAMSVATGAVDPARMGINGFSDGSVTVQFALINADLFKVASVGSCCEDMTAQPLAAGPRYTDYLRAMGFPYFEDSGEEFWKPISLLRNVDRVRVPILIQASDSEYEGALDVVEAYTHRGKPVEMLVFPAETHYKWQPNHRRAIYEQNIDWFAFWLANQMDCTLSKAVQYERWLAMDGAPSRSAVSCLDSPSSAP